MADIDDFLRDVELQSSKASPDAEPFCFKYEARELLVSRSVVFTSKAHVTSHSPPLA
jgi:hypothetical protein